MIEIKEYDETYIRIECDKGIALELREAFSFFVPGYVHMPAYKNTPWDGKIYLFNVNSQTIYKGLLKYIYEFMEVRDYEYQVDESLTETIEFSLFEAGKECQKLNLPFDPYEYQIEAVCHAIRNKRALFLSPTSSGKSLIIYLLARFYEDHKILIVVPTTQLVKQMQSDFLQYSENQFDDVLGITGKTDKEWQRKITNRVTVSTWQSLHKMPKSFFRQFDVVMGDEAHQYKAKSLSAILEKMTHCEYRFGFTGTIDDSQTHKLVLEGLFGPIYRTVTTKELMDDGKVAELKIKILNLKYNLDTRKGMARAAFQDEMNFIISNISRNKFIKNLTLSLKGNTLLLFQRVESHGEILHKLIEKDAQGRKVFFVSGKTDEDTRENVRCIVENETNAIIVASYGVFSTGVSIKAIHNVIFASPSKSRIRNLQSIGRGLRINETKTKCTLYDICDDLKYKTWTNHTLRHMAHRFKIYSEEKFKCKIYNIKLER